jgi:hypothetical protein
MTFMVEDTLIDEMRSAMAGLAVVGVMALITSCY